MSNSDDLFSKASKKLTRKNRERVDDLMKMFNLDSFQDTVNQILKQMPNNLTKDSVVEALADSDKIYQIESFKPKGELSDDEKQRMIDGNMALGNYITAAIDELLLTFDSKHKKILALQQIKQIIEPLFKYNSGNGIYINLIDLHINELTTPSSSATINWKGTPTELNKISKAIHKHGLTLKPTDFERVFNNSAVIKWKGSVESLAWLLYQLKHFKTDKAVQTKLSAGRYGYLKTAFNYFHCDSPKQSQKKNDPNKVIEKIKRNQLEHSETLRLVTRILESIS